MLQQKSLVMLVAFCGVALSGAASANPLEPVYTGEASDATVAGNSYLNREMKRRWFVTADADNYESELYERPTAQEFIFESGRYGAKEYFEYVDIASARLGVDDRFVYVSMRMVGNAKVTEDGARSVEGLKSKYGFRFSQGPDGRFGYHVESDQPETKNFPNTVWGSLGIKLSLDTDGDVGGAASSGPTGLTISKSVNSEEESGLSGYDSSIGNDGVLDNGVRAAWVRISPSDPLTVEFALDYVALGLTRAQAESLGYFDVEASAGGEDPQGQHRNDKFSREEAGSPYRGVGNSSIYGTQGLGSISEMDNVRLAGAGAATLRPIPATGGCVADVDNGTGTGTPDGGVGIEDLLHYISTYELGITAADVDDGSSTGTPDGGIGIEDLLYYMQRYDAGC